MSISDHCLLILSLMRKQTKKQGRKHFFFEAMWTRDERCREIIKGAWEVDRVDSAGDIRGRIKRYQEQLKKWNWMEFENVNKMPKEKKGETSTVGVMGQFTWECRGDQEGEKGD